MPSAARSGSSGALPAASRLCTRRSATRVLPHSAPPCRPAPPSPCSVKWWNGSQWQHVAPYQPAATTAADIDFGMAFHVSDAWGQLVCYIDRATYGLACKQPYRGRWRVSTALRWASRCTALRAASSFATQP